MIFHNKRTVLFILLKVFFLFFSSTSFAVDKLDYQNKNFSLENKYRPYLELGGIKYFNQQSSGAGIYDLFLPLLAGRQDNKGLLFADLRIFDRTGSSFEGNTHLGYRHLFNETKQMIGIYASFDRRRSEKKRYFNQITIGGEYWQNKWFIGGNIYTPIGKKRRVVTKDMVPEVTEKSWKGTRSIGRVVEHIDTTTTVKRKRTFEKSLYGLDAEVGHAFTEQLTGYAGGYLFQDGIFKSSNNREAKTKWGPRLRLTYDYNPSNTKKVFGILDGISFEAGVQHDKPRGTSGYIGIKLKVGLTNSEKTINLSGFERHMTELVRRDPDIVLSEENTMFTKQSSTRKKEEPERDKTLEELLENFGLPATATWKEVRKQYRAYALKYHPDKNKNGEKLFADYNALYELMENRFRNNNQAHDDVILALPRGDSTQVAGDFHLIFPQTKGIEAKNYAEEIWSKTEADNSLAIIQPQRYQSRESCVLESKEATDDTSIFAVTLSQESQHNKFRILYKGNNTNRVGFFTIISLQKEQSKEDFIGEITSFLQQPDGIFSEKVVNSVRADFWKPNPSRLIAKSSSDEVGGYFPNNQQTSVKVFDEITKYSTEPVVISGYEYHGGGFLESSFKNSSKSVSEEITQLNYEYSNLDIENILVYRLFELIVENNNELLMPLVITTPISKKTLLLSSNQGLFSSWIRKETELTSRKILIPIYLDNERHWISVLFEGKQEKKEDKEEKGKKEEDSGYLGVSYFDSLIERKMQNVSQNWLNQLLENSYDGKVDFVYGQAKQQSDKSVGCGAFAIENVIGILDFSVLDLFDIDNINQDEESIRKSHNELLEKYKGQSAISLINDLKAKGVLFVDLNSKLHLNDRARLAIIRGGKKEAEEVGTLDHADNNLESQNRKEVSIFQKSYNVVYQFINDHEYLLAPLSSAAAGGIRGGIWGIMIGGVLGIIDESLIYFGYTDRYYLTWSAFGVATGHVIKPSIVSDVVGATAGLLLPTGIPTKILSDHQELIAPTISAIAEGTKSGITGMVNGGMLGMMDEALIYYEFTDRHYLTFGTVGISVMSVLGWFSGMPFLGDSIGIVLGLIAAN